MSYDAKLDWIYDTPVMETDINRWEQGILDAHLLLDSHQASLSNLEIEIKAVKDALFNNFTDNVFFENFAHLNDVIVTRGWYDEANKKLVV